jgi:ribose-phosphate pyrophosphokinase
MGSVVENPETSRERGTGEVNNTDLKLFAGNANPELAQKIANYLGVPVGEMMLTRFADGEIRVKIEESARGCNVFIVQPTCSPANDNVMELMIMLDAFRRASASAITVVMPYYGYARQDKKTRPREPITARLIADMITLAGADRILTVDLHAEQIQGFFNVPVDHLYGGPIIGDYLIQEGFADRDDVVVVSPDTGSVGRAKALAEMLGSPFVLIAKRRPEPNKVEIVEIIGEFQDKVCVIIDDMIDTGGSIIMGAQALMQRGAKEVIATCTHPIFSGTALHRLQDSVISRIICLDTIPIARDKMVPKLTILESARLIGEAIRRIDKNESVSTLFNGWK